ncbi:efflux protein, MATE family [Chondromyces crocatus]|uniref:Multidrug-efflux transporter n=1 Tax=Chondromyces crocatus TaxID=52 RepID=A0A0K1E747_CHOCO|nr:efflux protein, MATE family [Chondromyces crocatus]
MWALAWPAITHMFLLTLVFLVNRAMVGRHSTTALAATQICTTLTWSIISMCSATSAGTLAVVARSIGARDRAGAVAAVRASLVFAAALGVLVAGPLLWTKGAMLRLLFPQADAEVIAQADDYLQIVLPVLPLAFLEAVAASALQGAGDTRTPLLAASAGNVVNVILSALLIFGWFGLPEMGLRGAAVGTAATMAIEGLLLIAVLSARGSPLPLFRREGVEHRQRAFRDALNRVLRVSLPAFAERATYQAGYTGFVVMIGLLGAAAMAANQALVSIESVCFLSAEGFGIAAGALVAQKLGEGNPREAASAGRTSAGLAIVLLSAFGLVFALVPRALIQPFTQDEGIVALGASSLYIAAVAQPFMAFAMVIGTALRAAGATRAVFVVTLVSSLVVRLVVTWLLAIKLGYGLVGVWVGSTADWMVRSAMLGAIWARGRWREISV